MCLAKIEKRLVERKRVKRKSGRRFVISNAHYQLLFQRNCIEFALNAKPVRRYIPKNPIQYKLWAFVTSPVFEYTIFAMILINTLSLAMKFYNQPQLYTQFLDVLNVIFTVFFTMEFVFKLGAFRFKVSVWRIFISERLFHWFTDDASNQPL